MVMGIHIIFKDGYKYWLVVKRKTIEQWKNYYMKHPNQLKAVDDRDKIIDVRELWSFPIGT
jgi:hypothetical protein